MKMKLEKKSSDSIGLYPALLILILVLFCEVIFIDHGQAKNSRSIASIEEPQPIELTIAEMKSKNDSTVENKQ